MDTSTSGSTRWTTKRSCSALFTSDVHAISRMNWCWTALHWLLGIPATLLAAVAGTTALVESTGGTAAGILALASAGLGAVLTTVNAPQRAGQAAASANVYLEIQTAARQHREIDLPDWPLGEAREALAALTARRDAQNTQAEVPSRRAYRRAQANLRAGSQTYAVDEGAD